MINSEFDKEYKRLNQEQKEAVNSIEGPVMVIAGPGTGKTQILAMRIANILNKTHSNPNNILCLTFTNSGMLAMKERLLKITGPVSYQIHVHTFHSFCNEIISLYPEKFVTSKRLNQLTDIEQLFIIQKILIKNNFKFLKPFKSPFYYQKFIISAINQLKQENISPQNFEKLIKKEADTFLNIEDLYHNKGPHKDKMKAKYLNLQNNIEKNKELAKIYADYKKILETDGKYDYGDMILFVLHALKTDSEILSTYQEKYQYILVDEYQDTNTAQNKIVEILGSFYDNPNIFVVGDDEQSVFRFQGASLENILFFKEKYKEAKIIILEKNYRSTQQILDVSRRVIENNKNQIFNVLNVPKKLTSQGSVNGNIKVGEFSNGSVESFFVAKEISKLIREGQSPSEIAVIYRKHKDVLELVSYMEKLNIPYILEAGGNILDDPEVNKIISYLKVVNFGLEQNDSQLLFEVMHYQFFGLSVLDIYKVASEANKKRKSLFDIVSSIKTLESLDLEEKEAISEFVAKLLECRRYINSTTFTHAFEFIINEIGYLRYLLSLPESVHHLNRLQSLFEEIKLLNIKNKALNLDGFLDHLLTMQENNLEIKEGEISANYEGVRFMTAHKSKGLEFSNIFMIKAADKHWGNGTKKDPIKLPSGILKTNKQPEETNEEERRLFYVALTRAKRNIYLTYSKVYGEGKGESLSMPSMFVSELPKEFIETINTKQYEDSFEERLKLTFAKKKWQPSQALQDYLQQLIKDFKLSATALNNYMECPQRFFYDNILRVPKTKNFSQGYGTAVHKALELLFKKFHRDFRLPNKTNFLYDFKEALEDEIFTDEERKRAEESGVEILSKYHDFYAQEWEKRGVPLSCEYDFSRHNAHFKDIPITGKIDRIDLINKTSNSVRIVDYKTSVPKSLNQIMGQTKEKDTKLLYQAYFYKLLSESDPLFKWRVEEIEFDFISPKNNKFYRVSLPIDESKYAEFKEIVEKVYDDICELRFHLDDQACKKGTGICEYFNICHN